MGIHHFGASTNQKILYLFVLLFNIDYTIYEEPSTQCWSCQATRQDAGSETPVAYSLGRQSQLWVEIGAVYNGSCKPQSCQNQKDNYITSSTSYLWHLCILY